MKFAAAARSLLSPTSTIQSQARPSLCSETPSVQPWLIAPAPPSPYVLSTSARSFVTPGMSTGLQEVCGRYGEAGSTPDGRVTGAFRPLGLEGNVTGGLPAHAAVTASTVTVANEADASMNRRTGRRPLPETTVSSCVASAPPVSQTPESSCAGARIATITAVTATTAGSDQQCAADAVDERLCAAATSCCRRAEPSSTARAATG